MDGLDAGFAPLCALIGVALIVFGLFPGAKVKFAPVELPRLTGVWQRGAAIAFGALIVVTGLVLAVLAGQPKSTPAIPPTTTRTTTSPNMFEQNRLYRLPGSSSTDLPVQAINQTQNENNWNPDALWVDYQTGLPVLNANVPVSSQLMQIVAAFDGSPSRLISWADHHLEPDSA